MRYLPRRPDAIRRDVDDELELHLQMRIEELVAGGLSIDDARREALRLFGDLEATRRYCRDQDQLKEAHVQRALMFQDFMQDIRICIRALRRAPLLTLTIVLTVGLGIGATAAIFSAVDAALLRPLPYAQPERLVRIYTDTPPFRFRLSAADYLALRDQQTHFEHIAAFTDRTMSFSNGESADLVRVRLVSSTFFGLLGIKPMLGRDFSEADDRPGSPQAVIVSHGFWQQRLGGRMDVLGTPVRLDGADYTLAGVLPPLTGPLERRQDAFTPIQMAAPPRKGPFLYWVIGRLRTEGDRAAAANELRVINKRIFPLWKASYQDDRATWSIEDLKAFVVGDVRTTAGLALAAVVLVWLIACANASNLLIARMTSRRQELAVRAALGASRARVVRYMLAESAVLCAGAVTLGAAVAWIGMRLLKTLGASYFPRMQEIAVNGAWVAILAALALLSGLIFGLVPALTGTGGPIEESLRSSGRSSTGSVATQRLRRVLVGAQFAIATPLLIVAALLLATLNELRHVDLGFDTRNVLTGSIRLPAVQYADPGAVTSFWNALKRQLEAEPDVAGVAFASGLAPNNVQNLNNFELEDFPTAPGQSQPATPWIAVTPDYVPVLGLKLLQGRLLDERDALRENIESVMVDRAWAKRFFPNQSAIGKRFHEGGCTTCPWTTVVGVVSDVKYAGLGAPDQGTVYWAMSQDSLTRYLVLRTRVDPESALARVRQIVRDLEPAAPLSNLATMDELTAESLERPRSLSVLVAAFAVVALALAAIGIYGVIGYYVQQHLKEISIRMALGGSAGSILRLIVGQAFRMVVSGVAIGVLTAFGLTRLIATLLFGVEASDPLTFAGVAILLIAAALVACAVPAARAVRLQPAMVLRNE